MFRILSSRLPVMFPNKHTVSSFSREITVSLAKSLLLCLLFTPGLFLQSEAAKKYYPPGFKLPTGLGSPAEQVPESPTLPISPSLEESTPAHPPVFLKSSPAHAAPKPKDRLTQLLEERRFYEALRLLDQQLKKAPHDLALRILRGQILREEENFQQAAAEYKVVLEKTRSKQLQAKAWSGLGMVKFSKGQHAMTLGDLYGAQAMMNEAEESFQRALRLSPQVGEAWLGRAQVAMAQKKLNEAEQFLQKAHQYGIPKVLEGLAKSQLLLLQGKPLQALPVAFLAKKEAPGDPRVYLLLGQLSIALDRVDDAIIHLKQALERTPDQPEALRLLSVAYERKMKPEDAELVLQKAISLNPQDLESVRALLKIYDQGKETERGILLLKTLLSKPASSPENPDLQAPSSIYQTELLERLCSENRWKEAFDQGSGFILNSAQANKSPEWLNLFCLAAYHSGQGLLNPQPFLTLPAVQRVMTLVHKDLQANPSNLQQRLNLLLLDPLASLPAYTKGSPPAESLPIALQISFLTGNTALHQAQLSQYEKDSNISRADRLQTISALYKIGDYTTASTLLQQSGFSDTTTELASQIADARKHSEEQLKVLEVLPRNIPTRHWEETAQEALLISRGNWKLHAVLAEALYQQKQYGAAWIHQRLAAQYAPSLKERDRWLKKAAKTRVLI